MNPPVVTIFGNPDPNAAPVNITQLVQLLNTLVFSQLQGSYIPYVLSNTTPGSGDQDKVWIQLDTVGRPVSVKAYYNGNWRRVYNGMLGEIRMYHGNPNTDFDTNGLGNIGGEYDGWHICNGNDGTPNLTDRFVVGAHMDNSNGHNGYGSDGWQTFVDGQSDLQTGGEASHLLVKDDLPPINPNGPSQTPAQRADTLIIPGHDWKDEDHTPDFQPLISNHYAGMVTNSWTLCQYGANPPTEPQTPVPTLPPFLALAFIIFVGY